MNKKVEFICSLASMGVIGGETIKNEAIYNYLIDKGIKVNLLDFESLKDKKIILLLKILFSLLNPFTKKIIISKASYTTYKYLKISKYFNIFNKEIIYFVIGASLDKIICEKNWNINLYKKVSKIYVETTKLKTKLNNLGLENIQVVPNFKNFKIRKIKTKEIKSPLKAVFFARIDLEKGIDMIFSMLEELNKDNKKIQIDFCGPISKDYESIFYEKLKKDNASKYLGVLKGEAEKIYEVLEKYDFMVFPTRYMTEGIPGTIIDSFIAGLPVVYSEWENYEEILNDSLGYSFELGNQKEFNKIIWDIVQNPKKLEKISKNCYKESEKYHIEKILEKILI